MSSSMVDVIEDLKQKSDIETYVGKCVKDDTYISDLLNIIKNDKTSIKFFAEKIIRRLSEINPEKLYPHFEEMSELLDSPNNFIKWGFIMSLPNLVGIDNDEKWRAINDKYISLIDSDAVVTSVNAIGHIPKILKKYHEYEDMLIPKLLSIDKHTYMHKGEISPECNNVAKMNIINCFIEIYANSNYKNEIHAFVIKNRNNKRKGVRISAAQFLKIYKAR